MPHLGFCSKKKKQFKRVQRQNVTLTDYTPNIIISKTPPTERSFPGRNVLPENSLKNSRTADSAQERLNAIMSKKNIGSSVAEYVVELIIKAVNDKKAKTTSSISITINRYLPNSNTLFHKSRKLSIRYPSPVRRKLRIL